MPYTLPCNRRGNITVLSLFLLVVMLGMVAFAVDVGYLVHARTELQRTADACALHAVSYLPDRSQATSAALATANENAGTVPVALKPGDIEFGTWDRETATFTKNETAGADNAVKVTLWRTKVRGNGLRLFFAPLLGTKKADANAEAVATYDHSLCGPLIGIEWVSVPGSPQTDSWDSNEGPYHSGVARDRGSLCSDGPIYVDGSAYVRGDARAGKGYQVTITGGATVTGNIGSRQKPLNLPPVDASQAASDNDNDQIPGIQKGNEWVSPVDGQGNFLLDGNKTLDLPPGTFYFRDFTVEGQATLNITGETTIYVTGNMRRAGGTYVNNNTQKAGKLRFFMTGGTAEVTSNNDFYGVIYAPETAVVIDGDSDLFGGVVGRTLTVTGSGFAHYDEALGLSQTQHPRRISLVH